jgi:hypothetical protein
VRFEIGDALAGLQKVGNLFQHCEFVGGDYGILTTKPSPSWPFVLLDSTFEGQRKAAILTEEAGMTIVRCAFREVPRGIEVRANRSEELVVRDSVFESVSDAAVVLSNSHNGRTQANLINVDFWETPVVARFRDRDEVVRGPGESFHVAHFSHGAHIDGLGQFPTMATRLELKPLRAESRAIPAAPARPLPSAKEWVSVLELGAVGDGEFDNTAVLREAIAQYDALYFPSGRYRISDTLTLRPQSTLIGLSPIATQLVVRDREAAFHPSGSLKAVVETETGGAPILSGIGIDPGAINHRAVALKWRGGEASLVDDVRFLGGHGTFDVSGKYRPIYNNNRSGDSDPERRWDSMPTSLWVTGGGGGTFQNLWTPSPFAAAGMIVENTSTPGWVYQISSEHHLRNEIIVRGVQNWQFYALQFEEESYEGRNTLPLRIEDSSNLDFHNTYVYRVGRTFTPYPVGIHVEGSQDLRFFGIHAYGPTKFTVDSTLHDADSGTRIRAREIARLDFSGKPTDDVVPLRFEVLAEGFNHLDSPEVDTLGRLYFVDARSQSIYRWDPATRSLKMLLEQPIEPEQILLDREDRLLIFTRVGKVYRFSPDVGAASLEELLPEAWEPEHEALESLHFGIPLTRWRDSHDFQQVAQELKPLVFRSGNLVIPAEASFVEAGLRTSYFRTLDLIRAFDLGTVAAGESVLVTDEFDQKTWTFTVAENGQLEDPQLFAEEGEAGALRLSDGSVLILAGDLFHYSTEGALFRRIAIAGEDRPTGMALGGIAGDTLFVLARTRLLALPLDAIQP